MEKPMLTSLSLTHVQFDPNDKIALGMAYITLVPLALLVFYASVIVSRREIASAIMLLGQLLNEALNAILKEYYRHPRPFGTGYGMPSSHAQFVWYFTVYGIIYMACCIQLDNTVWKSLAAIAMIAMAVLVTASRVYLHYHTFYQVMAGSFLGASFGVLWYLFVEWGLRQSGIINNVLTWRVSRWLCLRDMRHISNVVRWEYQQWEKHITPLSKQTQFSKKEL